MVQIRQLAGDGREREKKNDTKINTNKKAMSVDV